MTTGVGRLVLRVKRRPSRAQMLEGGGTAEGVRGGLDGLTRWTTQVGLLRRAAAAISGAGHVGGEGGRGSAWRVRGTTQVGLVGVRRPMWRRRWREKKRWCA